ncbi:MAG: efflux RND transporter periplasmic adaptor subunit [Deltaproteobacteria bacterium]|nr:efflux RND transporter periplasmic adaptor subunit [Deltaproteobacteria bacterium]
MKKSIKWIILVVVIAVAVIFYAYTEMQAGIPVQKAEVEKGGIRAWVEDRAMTTLPLVHKITMPQDGRILPITLEAGHAVKKGQVVAQMDALDLKTALAMADARIAEIQAQIAINKYNKIENTSLVESKQVIAALKAAGKASDELVRTNEAELEYSEWLLDMEKKLVKQKASSKEKLRRAQRDYGQADSSVASARFMSKATWAITAAVDLLPKYIQERLSLKHLETDVLNHRLAGARAERDLAERRLKRATMKSPVDGIILRRLVKNDEYLQAGTLLMEIGDMSDLQVTANILSQDVVTVRPGNSVDLYGPSIGTSPIRGTVSRIKPAGFTKVSSLGVDQQRVPVVIAFDADALKHLKEKGRTLGLAYRVRARIYTEEKKDVLKIPRTALFRGTGNQWQVFSVKNGTATLASVTLGIMNDNQAEITKGLKAGETIIVAPPKALRNGDRVKPS